MKRFKCGFCSKIYRTTAKQCLEHERICYRNPNRDCDTCQNEGVEMSCTIDSITLGVIPDGKEQICPSCLIAEEAGGKSYITQEIRNYYLLKINKKNGQE